MAFVRLETFEKEQDGDGLSVLCMRRHRSKAFNLVSPFAKSSGSSAMVTINRPVLASAVCAILSCTAAHALNRDAEYDAAVKVYFGGATATDNLLEAEFISSVLGICDPVALDIDIYRTNANQRVVTCRVTAESAAAAGVLTHGFAPRGAGGQGTGGTLVAFHKESQGGSTNGIFPLIQVAKGNAHVLRWLDVSLLAPADCISNAVAATPNSLPYTNHSACPTLALTPVDTAGSATYDVHGGISEIEPALHYPSAQGDAARLTFQIGLSVVQGVAVSTNLYRALQLREFGMPCNGSDLPNCVPSLTTVDLSSLYSQSVVDWAAFADAAGTPMPSVAGVVPPADSFVRICRRVAASGTQASYETYWLKERCGLPGPIRPFAQPDDSTTIEDTVYSPNDFASGSLVNAAPSSGNVRSCLASANAAGFWALGVLDTEFTTSNYNGGNGGFRFIKVGAFAPNRTNVANGDTDFFLEGTINRISNTFPGNVGALADGNPSREIVELVRERLGPTFVRTHVDPPVTPIGIGGALAPCDTPRPTTRPYSDAEMATHPVNGVSRFGNSCGPAFRCTP